MKKFLVILMVLAMASFLFAGCIPTAPAEEAAEEAAEEVAAVVKTDTPFITGIADVDLSSTATQYSNDPEVSGVGVPGAVIKVYLNGVQSGIGYTGADGVFAPDPIPVTLVDLTEGVTTLYVTATQPGLAESDKSTTYTFTYDETAPKIASAVADSTDQTVTVTFNEALNFTVPTATPTAAATGLNSALLATNWKVNGVPLVTDAAITKVSSTVVKIDLDDDTSGAVVPAGEEIYTLSYINIADSLGNATSATTYSSIYIDVVTD